MRERYGNAAFAGEIGAARCVFLCYENSLAASEEQAKDFSRALRE
jgi:hypothetical protein